ncbi:MAG: Mur ligase domain-containing protein, partial [Rhodospirillales bacterium]|nr:Mur ligase domain-containing protein [Rhodospirillales bacterium]
MINQAAAEGLDINGLTCDSRRVEPGFLFAALPGARADGRTFIDEALRRGAVAVLGPPGTRIDDPGQPVTLLVDDNPLTTPLPAWPLSNPCALAALRRCAKAKRDPAR